MELLRPLSDAAFAGQSVAYTSSAGTVTGWPAGPQGVVVWCTSDAYIVVGEGVTATSTGTAIPANTPIPFYVPQAGGGGGSGAPWRVSAMQVSAAGTLYAKPINIR
jgi:hypothetical protein